MALFNLFGNISNMRFLVSLTTIFLLTSVSHSRKSSDPRGDEYNDFESKTIDAKTIFRGLANEIHKKGESTQCVKFSELNFLKGDLDKDHLTACRHCHKLNETKNMNCTSTRIKIGSEYVIFLNSSEPSLDGNFYYMSSSPVTSKKRTISKISRYLSGEPPTLTKIPEEGQITKTVGESFNIACYFSGFLEPTVNWLKDNSGVSPTQITIEKTYTMLEFQEVKQSDAGTYTCIVSDQFGSSINASTTLQTRIQHAEFCEDDSFCLNGGTCQHSNGHKFCLCPPEYQGLRCHIYIGQYNLLDEIVKPSGVNIILTLISVVAVVITVVVILLYAAIRGCYMENKYKKIKPDQTCHEIKSEHRFTAKKVNIDLKTETNGDIVVSHQQIVLSRPPTRSRLFGSSITPEESTFRQIENHEVLSLRGSSNLDFLTQSSKDDLTDGRLHEVRIDIEKSIENIRLTPHEDETTIADEKRISNCNSDTGSEVEPCELLYIDEPILPLDDEIIRRP